MGLSLRNTLKSFMADYKDSRLDQALLASSVLRSSLKPEAAFSISKGIRFASGDTIFKSQPMIAVWICLKGIRMMVKNTLSARQRSVSQPACRSPCAEATFSEPPQKNPASGQHGLKATRTTS